MVELWQRIRAHKFQITRENKIGMSQQAEKHVVICGLGAVRIASPGSLPVM
jgi:hypothetical protein